MINLIQRFRYYVVVLALFCQLGTSAAASTEIDQGALKKFINEMVIEHGFIGAELEAAFAQVRRSKRVIKAMSRPAEKAKPWYEYRQHFLDPVRIKSGVSFWKNNAQALTRASQTFGVAPEVIVAIIGVETSYGAITGKDRVMDALATLAFHYPENRSNRLPRMKFFRTQLAELLILAREQKVDPTTLTGSYAGAMGIPQFMPDSYRIYAVDFNDDGRRDIWSDPTDAIGSVANYLEKKGGWLRDQPVARAVNVAGVNVAEMLSDNAKPQQPIAVYRHAGIIVEQVSNDAQAALIALDDEQGQEYWITMQNFYAIMRYNPRTKYAMAVYQLSDAIAQAYRKHR